MKVKEFIEARIAEELALADEAAGVTGGMEYGDANWCKSWLQTGIRHLVRNCDIECPKHDDDPAACGWPHRYAGAHIATWDPQRVRAEAEFKRFVVGHPSTPAPLLYEMAGLWADHPDYRSIFEHLL